MKEHYIISIGRGRLGIYKETPLSPHLTPRLGLMESFDFPVESVGYTDQPPQTPDPFPNGPGQRSAPHPDRTDRSRMLSAIAREVDNFLQEHPAASWDFAAEPTLYDELIERLSPDTQRRLKRVLSVDGMGETADDAQPHLADAPLA